MGLSIRFPLRNSGCRSCLRSVARRKLWCCRCRNSGSGRGRCRRRCHEGSRAGCVVAGGELWVREAAVMMVVALEERLGRGRGRTFHGGEDVEERQELQSLIEMAERTSPVYVSVRPVDSYQDEELWEVREWPSENRFVVLSAQALETC